MTTYLPDDRVLSFGQKRALIKKNPDSPQSQAAIDSSVRIAWAMMVQARLLTMEPLNGDDNLRLFDKRTLKGMLLDVPIDISELCVIVNEICKANAMLISADIAGDNIVLSADLPHDRKDAIDVTLLNRVASASSVQ